MAVFGHDESHGLIETISKIDLELLFGDKADLNHTHSFESVTDKPTTYPPSTHDHNGLYYTKSEITTNYKLKGDFAVISGNVYVGASTSANGTVNYPSGFTQSNCVCVGFGIQGGQGWNYQGDYNDSMDAYWGGFHRALNLGSSNITAMIRNPNTSAVTFYFKVILMKV